MKMEIEINGRQLKDIILKHLQSVLAVDRALELTELDVTIEVKSKQNYKSEWENADFRARVSRTFD